MNIWKRINLDFIWIKMKLMTNRNSCKKKKIIIIKKSPEMYLYAKLQRILCWGLCRVTSLLRVNFLSLCNLCWFFIGAADEIMFMFLITTKQVQMLWNYQLLIQGTYREIPKIRLADYVNRSRSIGYRSARIIQVRHDFPPVRFCFVFLSFLVFFRGGGGGGGGGRVNVAVCLFCLFVCFFISGLHWIFGVW